MIALLRFHLAAGARIALVASVPVAGIAVVAVGMQENPADALLRIAASIAGPARSVGALTALSLASLGLALWAVPRVTLGSQGWIRHLPVSRAQHRIALVAATACAQAPLVVAVVACAVICSLKRGAIAWTGFFVSPLLALAMAALALALRPVRRRAVPHRWGRPHAPLGVRIAWRAVGPRLFAAWLTGALPLGATALFLTNNELPPDLAHRAIRLGGTLATTLVLAGLADTLAIRRPSWPWARSLPVAAHRRVAGDALMLAVSTAPVLLATAGFDLPAAVTVAAVLPFLALRATAAMRRGGDFRSAASGPVLIEGAFAAALIALVPWLAFAALAAVPVALRAAIERERALKVTRWSALHHVAAGDTHAWTR